ncbi:hypothetical protein E2C01_098885 [Portunus trituberculatus]|uniref:Uncharacterized protein n=1 Tax=Portunus trituberculatus TaxID=210409 RepID=A0A5B7KD94_PORTR|nr:hypothetical protein [Portunus trituberculatus]
MHKRKLQEVIMYTFNALQVRSPQTHARLHPLQGRAYPHPPITYTYPLTIYPLLNSSTTLQNSAYASPILSPMSPPPPTFLHPPFYYPLITFPLLNSSTSHKTQHILHPTFFTHPVLLHPPSYS